MTELEEVQHLLRRVIEIAQEPAWRPQGKGQGSQGTPEQMAKLHVLSKLLRIRRLTEGDYVRYDDREILLFTGQVLRSDEHTALKDVDGEVVRVVDDTAEDELDEDLPACGNVYDHDDEIKFEDDEIIQWECRRCGAEGWEDK